MIIGSKGMMLKRIGTMARKEMELVTSAKVFSISRYRWIRNGKNDFHDSWISLISVTSYPTVFKIDPRTRAKDAKSSGFTAT